MNSYSFTSITKYQECGMAFKLHYLDKIRSPKEQSAFTFGGAIDKAFEVMLVHGLEAAKFQFNSIWSRENVLTGNEEFTKSDYDEFLLEESELSLPDNERTFITLQRRGLIILDSLHTNFLPLIEHVYSTQERIRLTNSNESGDSFIGLVDFVIKLKGYDKPIIGDLKTTSVKYKEDSVRTSPQLTMYTHALEEKYNTRLAGYFVVNKKLTKVKKCHDCTLDFTGKNNQLCKQCGKELSVTYTSGFNYIVDEIPRQTEDEVIDKLDESYHKIKAGVFEQNRESCIHPIYKRRCPYYNLCWSNSMEGLIDLKKKKDIDSE
jgi:hypothetical protein